jgi:hypothetical protein
MKRYSSIFFMLIALTLASVLSGGLSSAAEETTVEKILSDRDSYDGKEVSLSGTVSTPKFKATKSKKPYMTFPLLGDSGARINIFVWGDLRLKPGKRIGVTGIYRKGMEMGKYTFRDAIESGRIDTDQRKEEEKLPSSKKEAP